LAISLKKATTTSFEKTTTASFKSAIVNPCKI
jgi:hypothetical protein